MALQFQGHRHLDDVIARLEKRYGKAGGKTPQPSEAHFKKNQPPKRQLNLKILQPARRQVSFQPPAVLDTGELPATVTTRRKRKRAPTMPRLSEKEDRKRRMKKRHWYEDKFGDLSKFVKKPRKRSAQDSASQENCCQESRLQDQEGKRVVRQEIPNGEVRETPESACQESSQKPHLFQS